MTKPWSISTTVRNPERIRDFLIALRPLVGDKWDTATQVKYQKLLIKHRLYGYGSQQFYNGLPREIINTISDIDSEIDDQLIDELVELKKYKDFPMRGRQSINPLIKFGFASVRESKIYITELGQKLIDNEHDFGDVFLRAFLKWQIPNLASNDYAQDGHYNVIPFVATLKLIAEVNSLEAARGNKPVGLQKREFALFVPSLINYNDISSYAREIIALRDLQRDKSVHERKEIRDTYRYNFAKRFLETTDRQKITSFLNTIQDYGDNTIRYFRLTKFVRIRGNGFYIDLEPSRQTEIESLFEYEFYKAKAFTDKEEYLHYLSDAAVPQLPWQTKEKMVRISTGILAEIRDLLNKLNEVPQSDPEISTMNEEELISLIGNLRSQRQDLQERYNHVKSQPINAIDEYIDKLENIFNAENRPLMLEYYTTLGIHSLNDAIEIRPNYPVGDDNEPTSTAPGGVPDIECYYSSFNMICEVTMLRGRDQWFNEGQPVMRHLRNFETLNSNAYCIFIAPSIHVDSAETFWIANTVGYRGSRQRIAPITISQFILILKTLKQIRETNRPFRHDNLRDLLKVITQSTESKNNSDEWVADISNIIGSWSLKQLS